MGIFPFGRFLTNRIETTTTTAIMPITTAATAAKIRAPGMLLTPEMDEEPDTS